MTHARSGSLRFRLLLGTVVAAVAALLLAGLFIADLFAAHVRRTVEEDLTHHLSELVEHSRVDPDGAASVAGALSDPRFQEPGSGMSWWIDVPGHASLRSASWIAEARPSDRTVERTVTLTTGGRPVVYAIRADGRLLDREIAAFHSDLALSLSALAVFLILGISFRDRYGLRPLARLGEAVDALRNGERDQLPEDVPSEFRTLVTRLNQLLHSQSVLVARGRLEAGNLAHGLRTPLALIGDEVEKLRDAGRQEAAAFIQQQCGIMRRQIDYHLRRASAGGTGQEDAPVLLLPMLDQILAAMRRLHRDAGCTVHVAVEPRLSVQADPGDMFEILSNLIDNAFKWAAGRIAVSAAHQGDRVVLTVDDDGPGIAADRRQSVLRAGQRLDDTVPGHGLGLAIVADLAAMNSGLVNLGASAEGGLRVTVSMRSGTRP